MRVIEPTQEEFDAWRQHPCTEFVAAAYAAKADECRWSWGQLFNARLVPVDLETKRQILSAQEDVFRAFSESTLNDFLAAVRSPETRRTGSSVDLRPPARLQPKSTAGY